MDGVIDHDGLPSSGSSSPDWFRSGSLKKSNSSRSCSRSSASLAASSCSSSVMTSSTQSLRVSERRSRFSLTSNFSGMLRRETRKRCAKSAFADLSGSWT